MSDLNKALLLDLNFRTALLESVDWDEPQCASLFSYLQESLASNEDLPHDILNHIKLTYGDNAHDLIKEIFVDAYIENGLYINPEDDYEH